MLTILNIVVLFKLEAVFSTTTYLGENAMRRKSDPSRMFATCIGLVLAGGRGSRLQELTDYRCKPALFFGKHRLCDFVLSNFVNSLIINEILIYTQYEQIPLIRHVTSLNLNAPSWGKSAVIVPAQQRFNDDSWYAGTANAVYQNMDMLERSNAEFVIIAAADHIYKLDFRQMLEFHLETGAQMTVCGMSLSCVEAAGNFGVMELDNDSKIIGFEEKPEHPKCIPHSNDTCFASLGIYIVNKKYLLQCLLDDHDDQNSEHDFGKNIIPKIISQSGAIYGYNFNDNIIPGEVHVENGQEIQMHYWRDVGQVSSYFWAVMDIVSPNPYLNLYNPVWPISTAPDRLASAKFVMTDKKKQFEFGNSFIASGCIIDNPTRLENIAFSRSVRTMNGVDLEGVIAFENVSIGTGCTLLNTIVEEGVHVPNGMRCGFDVSEDTANGVVIDKYHNLHASHGPIRIITRNSFK